MAVTPTAVQQPLPAVAEQSESAGRANGWVVLDYLGISLLIMLPLWRPGFILTMDATFVPHERFVTAQLLSMQPIVTGIAALNLVLPADIIEKLLFTGIFVLAGLGMHRLVVVRHEIVRYIAGILAVFNPFVYEHFMYGQWTIVLGYALLPWLLVSIRGALAAQEKVPVWSSLRVAAWWTVITIASVPMGLIASVAVVIVLAWTILLQRDEPRRPILMLCGLVAGWFAALNAYWIIPQIVAPSPDAVRAMHFGTTELTAFATQSDPTWGSIFTVLGGYGFWAEGSTRFTDLRSALPYWSAEPIAMAILGVVAIWHTMWRREGLPLALRPDRMSPSGRIAPDTSTAPGGRAEGASSLCDSAPGSVTTGHRPPTTDHRLTTTLALCLIIATPLAIGMASPPTAAVTRFLFAHSTLYHGLRDTQKWAALVLIAEIALAACGLDLLLTRIERTWHTTARALGAVYLLLPLIFVPTLFWGFAGQLNPVQYPASWSAANAVLTHDSAHGTTLFLPWHEYLRFPFTGRVIANPAQSYFDVPVIQGDNMEMNDLSTDSVNPTSAAISQLLSTGETQRGRFAQGLARLDIKYVVLATAADWHNYRYLGDAPYIRLLHRWRGLILYRNLSWRQPGSATKH